MFKKNIKYDDTEIEEYEFHQYKNPISINDIDINKIVVSNKFPSGKQDFKYMEILEKVSNIIKNRFNTELNI